jgi:hypothetical protein
MPHLSEVVRSLRGVLAREALPPPPPRAPAAAEGSPGLLRRLLAPERLPLDPEPPRPAGRSLLTTVFAPEALPVDPAAPAALARTAWLRWLFAPERLDRPGAATEEE